uniref:Uncharacterized protein n=1 Tax=uncultured prokaryote TaxID=198431 RepID=A0A0H5PZX5_9ZZZZ|nr:hypothetical protein [uncultured prokaryote]
MANYTVSKQYKKIYVDVENLTHADMLFIQLKQNEGYSVEAKKPRKAKKGASNKGSAKNPTKAFIMSKVPEEAKEEAEDILNGSGSGHGFFALKSWAKEKGYI